MRRIYANIEEYLSIGLVGALCVVVTLQVFFRLVIRAPLSWSEEMATILFIWITLIGSSLALKRGEHFAVEILHRKLRPADKRIAGIIVGALLIIFSLLMLWEGGGLAWRNLDVVTPAMEIPRAVPYAAMPAGGFLMLLRSIEILFRNARRPAGEAAS